MIERKTMSPKCLVSSPDTALARLLRTSNMVRTTPKMRSFGSGAA
jgi:hypothetical protein